MASAKFLEEALSTDVDESAVNAIVGSLETQLVTASPGAGTQVNSAPAVIQNHVNSAISNGGTPNTQKHGVANGGAGESVNILLNNSDATKSSLTPHPHTNVVGAIPASGYINQIQQQQSAPVATTSNQQQSSANLIANKHHEPIKILYPNNNNQTLSSGSLGGVVNLNSNRVTFPVQTLPNGNVNQQTVLNAVTSSVQSVASQSIVNSNVNKGVIGSNNNNMVEAKPQLVIKTTSAGPQPHLTGMVTVPMTSVSHTGSSSVVTLAKNIAGASQQQVVGTHPSGATTLLPANVQILNVNSVRPSGPAGQGQKSMPQRVVIGAPHMVGARPGQPGHITLQALQGLQPGTSGHLLLKTENGQYQLLRVGAAPTTPAAAAITPTGSPATATTGMPTTTYRLQSVPASAATRPTTPMQQHTVVTAGGTTTTVQAGVTTPNMAVAAQAAAAAQLQLQKQAVDSTKEKCRKFLANLLELSSREPKQVEKNVRTLIQELIDTKVEPEEFCDRLERLLNASPQPCLIGFLKMHIGALKSLPLLRQALITKELVIDGIRPPPHTVVFSLASGGMMVPQLQARGATMQPHLRPAGQQQMRVMGPHAAQVMPRAPHTIQHRLVTVSASAASAAVSAATSRAKLTALSPVRPHMNAQTKVMSHLVTSAATSMSPSIITHSPSPMTMIRQQTPSIITPKTLVSAKEAKEKKTFSSSGYTGDDDINDVAAMGGVNLAEETQRILGSTEFVGTQIRSVKDEMFLHSGILQQKIKQILAKHGLDDCPTNEVAALVSHAAQERLKNLAEKLAVIAEHRLDMVKSDSRYEVVQDTKTQLRFLEDLDRLERRRHEEQERELLLRAAKSRSKSEDPEQAKLKAKAKEMQRAEMEELRQREANLTALQAIGPRKKPKLELNGSPSTSGQTSVAGPSGSSTSTSRSNMPLRPRVKRVNLRDLLFLLEQERETCRTPFLYKAYLK